MSLFTAKIEIGALTGSRFETVELMVDTGSTYTWLPCSVITKVGAVPRYKRQFQLANGKLVERDVTEVSIKIDGEALTNLVVIAEPGDHHLLGSVTLETFSLGVDPVNRKLVKVVASAMRVSLRFSSRVKGAFFFWSRGMLTALLLGLGPAPVWALFESFNLAVKPTAMNNVFSAIGEEPSAVLYNPSQLTQMRTSAFSLAYSRPQIGFGEAVTNIFSAFYAMPVSKISWGLGTALFNTNFNYREIQVFMSYANNFGPWYQDRISLAWGTNLRVLSLRRGDPSKPLDPALVLRTTTKFTADLGLLLRYRKVFLGFSGINLIPADFGVVTKSEVPKEYRIGLGIKRAYQVPGTEIAISPAIEVSRRQGINIFQAALNTTLLSFLDAQLGGSQDNISVGFTVLPGRIKRSDVGSQPEPGRGIRIDLSYLYPISGLTSAGSIQAGVLFGF